MQHGVVRLIGASAAAGTQNQMRTCAHVDGIKWLLPLQRIAQHVARPQLDSESSRSGVRSMVTAGSQHDVLIRQHA